MRARSNPMSQANFGVRLKGVLGATRALAGAAHATMIDTEHQLVAVCTELEHARPELCRRFELDAEDVGRALTEDGAPSAETIAEPQHLPYSMSAKASLELAMHWRRELGHALVEPEHLLLGLVGEGAGRAGHLLRRRGVTVDAVAKVLRDLGSDLPHKHS